MAGRIHHSLKPTRHLVDRLGMNPELIDQIKAATDCDHHRMKAEQNKRHAKQEPECRKIGPGLPQRSREIVVLAGMVVYMGSPHPADTVPGAVYPIVFEIIEDKAQRPGPQDTPPFRAKVEQAILPNCQEQQEEKAAEDQTGDRAAQTERKTGQRIAWLIRFGPVAPGPDHLNQDERDKAGHSVFSWREIRHRLAALVD